MTTKEEKEDLARLEKVYKNLQKTICTKRKKLGIHNKRKKQKKPTGLRVTANAVLRYLQLVEDYDIQSVKTKILNLCENSDDRNYFILEQGDYKFVIANDSIVNIFKLKEKIDEDNHE